MSEINAAVRELATEARSAAARLAVTTTDQKNRALQAIADLLAAEEDAVLAANARDVAAAAKGGLSGAMLKRLTLTAAKAAAMVDGVRAVADLLDPVGEVLSTWQPPSGIAISRVRVPLGVVGIIYESRPNVTIDAAVLCLKAGNAVLLKGGAEAAASNAILVDIIRRGLRQAGLPPAAAALVPGGREGAQALMQASGLVDVLIPRGGAGLIQAVVEGARVPVIETGTGVCHVYVHGDADAAMATAITLNAKLSNPAVCNAMETLLVDQSLAEAWLPGVARALQEAGVELYGCPETCRLVPTAAAAGDDDWAAEYLDLKLAVRVVSGLDEALAHIARWGTRHSEAIVTGDAAIAERFLHEVDAAAVYANASTRFTDGFEFGFGAEIGISTQKLHARGPMGLPELTSIKYVVRGDGQTR